MSFLLHAVDILHPLQFTFRQQRLYGSIPRTSSFRPKFDLVFFTPVRENYTSAAHKANFIKARTLYNMLLLSYTYFLF